MTSCVTQDVLPGSQRDLQPNQETSNFPLVQSDKDKTLKRTAFPIWKDTPSPTPAAPKEAPSSGRHSSECWRGRTW